MKKSILALAVVMFTLGVSAEPRPDTLREVLDAELNKSGWILSWDIRSDFPVLENGKKVLKRKIPLGSKIRMLTAQSEQQGEFQVWICKDYQTLAIKPYDYVIEKGSKCVRMNSKLDL